MGDHFVEHSRQSWGQNIGGSIFGMLLGLVLFVGSFPLHWWNQGRPNLGTAAESAVAVSGPDGSKDGKLVTVTGTVTTAEQLGDEYLKPADYVALDRQVEMFAWVEHSSSETKQKVGGGSETTTTYDYAKEWTSSPEPSSGFKHPEGHDNPSMTVEAKRLAVGTAKVGELAFKPGEAGTPTPSELTPTPDMLLSVPAAVAGAMPGSTPSTPATPATPATPNAMPGTVAAGGTTTTGPRIEGNYLYRGRGSLAAPQVGDVRISYSYYAPGGDATLIGKLSGTEIQPFLYQEKQLYRLFPNTSAEEAVAKLKFEHKAAGWGIGVVAFLMMWFGMTMILGPISAVAAFLPFLGNLSRSLIGCVTFPVALGLSLLVVFVSKAFHSPIALLGLVVVCGGGAVMLVRKASAKREAAVE